MKIVWSNLAIDRLEEIIEYIAYDNPKAARKLAEKIFSKVEILSEYPERGRNLKEIRRKDIREVLEGNYRIIYKIEAKRIVILTIRLKKRLIDRGEL